MIQQFKFENTEIEGLKIIQPFIAYDERGFFMKTYEKNIFEENGVFLENGEDMTSFSHKGVLRGVHFQTENSQDKLVRVLHGEVWDVVVDLRKKSPTFGQWKGFTLNADNKISIYIPSGFAHGFLALSDEVIFSYRCGKTYCPNADSGILWNDKTLNIDWPIHKIEPNMIHISQKDMKLQTYQDFLEKYEGL